MKDLKNEKEPAEQTQEEAKKDDNVWGILLLGWSAVLAVQLLSYYGVLPLGKVHVGFILVSCVGMGVSIGHFWKRKPKS